MTTFLISVGAKKGFELLNPSLDKRFLVDKKGLKQGYWEYKVTKKVIGKGEFKNDEKTGVWKFYFLNGKIEREGTYKNGLKNGIWRSYFYPDDNPDLQLVNIEKFVDNAHDGIIKLEL